MPPLLFPMKNSSIRRIATNIEAGCGVTRMLVSSPIFMMLIPGEIIFYLRFFFYTRKIVSNALVFMDLQCNVDVRVLVCRWNRFCFLG